MFRLKRRIREMEEAQADGRLLEKPTGLWRGAWRRLLRRKGGVIGLAIIGSMLFVAAFAPWLAPHDPQVDSWFSLSVGPDWPDFIGEPGVERRAAPCVHAFGCDEEKPQFIMGLDGNFRDEFSRLIHGARVSLSVGFTTVLVALSVGSVLGAVAGFWGGWTDNIIMRVMDVVLGFPSLLLAIAIVSALGPGLRNTLFAIAIVSIPAYARIMRAGVLSIKELDFVAASLALGAGKLRILWTRVVPNALTPLVVIATLGIATAILDAAAFGFLGLGAQPPQAEWGAMLADERNQLFTAPHLTFFPGIAIMITVLGFNLLGDGLRDALDPALSD